MRRLIMQIMERFLLLSFLVLVLGLYSGCSNDGTNSTPSGAGGAGGTSEPAAPTRVSGKVDDDGLHVWLNAPAGGDGSSWENAFGNLQDAINTAATHSTKKTVYVTQGTYKPTSCPDQANGECADGDDKDRKKHFALKDNVSVYGGYSGQGDRKVEDPSKTFLSGDIGTKDNDTDNAYHVFYHPEAAALTDKAKLLNVTITKGNANGSADHNDGGGMYNKNSSPTLKDVSFTSNKANSGGGMYNKNSSPNLTNVNFTSNAAFYGGGMANDNSSSPKLIGGTFSNNTVSSYSGGGMYNNGSSPELTDVTFTSNAAPYGGGMYNYKSSPSLNTVTFKDNTATGSGGGMSNSYNSSPTLNTVTFKDNIASTDGGGMANDNSSSPTLTNVTFTSNTASTDGGGMSNENGASPELTGVTFTMNEARSGGGMANNGANTKPILNTGTSFNNNIATNYGGGMYNYAGSSPTFTSVCTFTGNMATGDEGSGGAIYDSNDSTINSPEKAQDGDGKLITLITADNGKTNGYYKEPAPPGP